MKHTDGRIYLPPRKGQSRYAPLSYTRPFRRPPAEVVRARGDYTPIPQQMQQQMGSQSMETRV